MFAITLWLSTLLVVGGLGAQQIALLNRYMRFIPLATIDVTCTALSAAVGVAAAWDGFGYWSLVLMQAANGLTILAMAWSWSRWWPSLPRRHVGTMSLLRFGGHMTGFNLIGFIGTNLDMVLIGKFGDRVALGLYDRAYKLIASPMGAISLPVSRVAHSLLARLLITVPVVAFIAAQSATLVPFLLGPAWTDAAPIAAAIAVATGFAPLSLSASWLFVTQGRTAEQLRFATGRTALIVTAVLVGLPWGALGVARAYAAFGLVMHGLRLLRELWGLGFAPRAIAARLGA